jgi:hypothetical protein
LLLEGDMTKRILQIVAASVFVAVTATAAWAQQTPVQVSGSITAVDGAMLTVKSKDGTLKIKLMDNAGGFGVTKATLADVKPGSFIGVGAMPQPDGIQRARCNAVSARGTVPGLCRTAP